MSKFCRKCGAETERYASGKCKPCQRTASAAWAKENPDKHRSKSAKWAAANPEKVRAANAAWYAANREKARASRATWQAANPEKKRARDAAYRAASREKLNARSAAYRAANPEKCHAAIATWRAANPEALRIYSHNRRARASGGKLSNGLAERLYKLQRGKCACGCKQPLGDNYHLDHIMPLALGGTNEDENIQLLRATCNLRKHDKHPVEFMQQRGFLL